MTKIKENEEGMQGDALADDDSGSRRGMLKQIGLTAAALVATAFTSSKASAQGERTAKPPTEQQILAELKKRGITNLEQLARQAAAGGQNLQWCFIVKGKFIYRDDAK